MIVAFFLFGFLLQEIAGHGMMLYPPGRSSAWRIFEEAPHNYDDNALNCGGMGAQFWKNAGKCGICGDPYNAAHPQDNENTGTFGRGIVVAEYTSGSIIDTNIYLTVNHKGSFNYSLCVLDDPNTFEPGEECFYPLLLDNGLHDAPVDEHINEYNQKVQLPDITCERCVLRWTYRAGNGWGTCDDGTQAEGCGFVQEHFRSCADIRIVQKN